MRFCEVRDIVDKRFLGFVGGVGEYLIGEFGDVEREKMEGVMDIGYEGVLL